MEHRLKILPKYFKAIQENRKTFEIRENNRKYNIGDTLVLREWDGRGYTGRELKRIVAYVLDDRSGYVLNGYVIMSICPGCD